MPVIGAPVKPKNLTKLGLIVPNPETTGVVEACKTADVNSSDLIWMVALAPSIQCWRLFTGMEPAAVVNAPRDGRPRYVGIRPESLLEARWTGRANPVKGMERRRPPVIRYQHAGCDSSRLELEQPADRPSPRYAAAFFRVIGWEPGLVEAQMDLERRHLEWLERRHLERALFFRAHMTRPPA